MAIFQERYPNPGTNETSEVNMNKKVISANLCLNGLSFQGSCITCHNDEPSLSFFLQHDLGPNPQIHHSWPTFYDYLCWLQLKCADCPSPSLVHPSKKNLPQPLALVLFVIRLWPSRSQRHGQNHSAEALGGTKTATARAVEHYLGATGGVVPWYKPWKKQ